MGDIASQNMAMNPHGMDPVRVLNLVASLGTIAARVLVVGCEPHDFGDELEGRMGLSAVVQAVIYEACNMLEELARQALAARKLSSV
jgi:hydrogenase maturation protease